MLLNRKRKTKDPCQSCGLHRNLCICDSIPTLDLKTKICLVIHKKELKRTTNTGQLAIKCLVNSEMRIRGEARGEMALRNKIHVSEIKCENNSSLDLSDLLTPNYRTLLFFPADDAVELNKEFVQQSTLPIQLIVPDGNWRQASKVHSRHPELKNIIKVKISFATLLQNNISQLHLRAEHFRDGMAILQAIAYALGVIEGPEVMSSLLKLYQLKLERTLLGRGKHKELQSQKDLENLC